MESHIKRKLDESLGKEVTLGSVITCTIIQIINISDSQEKTLEDWKYYHNPNTAPFERLDHVNRPIIYGIDLDASESSHQVQCSRATYKLLLCDSHQAYFYAYELEELPFLRPMQNAKENPLPIPLGGRIRLQPGTLLSEGFVLLQKSQCVYLGQDPDSDMSAVLNEGVVSKYIDFIQRSLKGI